MEKIAACEKCERRKALAIAYRAKARANQAAWLARNPNYCRNYYQKNRARILARQKENRNKKIAEEE